MSVAFRACGLLLAGSTSVVATAQIHPLDPAMLTVSSDPNVLVSRHYGLAWYRAGIPLTGRTVADIDGICAAVKTRVGGPWRAPYVRELETLSYKIWPRQFDPSRAFHDTPDRRHFGRLMPGRKDAGYMSFPAKDWSSQDGRIFWYTTMRTLGHGGVMFDSTWATSKQSVKYTSQRLLCVSNYGAAARR